MTRIFTSTVVLQPFAVIGNTEVQPYDSSQFPTKDPAGNTYFVVANANASGPIALPALTESKLLKQTFSSVPVLLRSQFSDEYAELGHALNEMVKLEDDDDWKIDTPVYQVACQVAAELSAHSYPAPQVFTHGPQSVVFNWSHDLNNLYLTITSDFISALASTPERIQRRVDLSTKQLANPTLAIRGLLSFPSEQPAIPVRIASSQVEEFIR